MNRVGTAARLQLVAWPAAFSWPWAILAISWSVNAAIYAVLRHQGQEAGFTGGLVSIYLVMFVAHLQAMSRGLPLALGLSLSRRSYYLGMASFAVAQAVGSGVVLWLLRLLEDATAGWGLDMRYFGVPFVRQADHGSQLLVYIVPFVLVAAWGMALGGLFRRWGANGLLAFSAGLLVVGGAAVALLTLRGGWPAIGRWFGDQSAVGLLAAWPALMAVLVGAAGYLVVRRTTA